MLNSKIYKVFYVVNPDRNLHIKSQRGKETVSTCSAASPCLKVNAFAKCIYNVLMLPSGHIGNAVSGKFTLSQCKTHGHKAPPESFYQS